MPSRHGPRPAPRAASMRSRASPPQTAASHHLPPYQLPAPPVVVADTPTLRAALAGLAPQPGAALEEQPVADGPTGFGPGRPAATWHPIGIDAEWRPETERGARHPVAVLQLACRDRAYVLDTHSLFGVAPPGEAMEPTLEQRDAALEFARGLAALLTSPSVCLVGHTLKGDVVRLRRTLAAVLGGDGGDLARTLPPVGVTAIDVAVLAKAAAATAAPGRASLAALTETLLQRRLPHKHAAGDAEAGATIAAGPRVTLSDWAARPLTPAQVEYASQDAHAPVAIFDVLSTDIAPRLVATPAARVAVSGGVRHLWAADAGPRSVVPRPVVPTPPPRPAPAPRPPPAHELQLASLDMLMAAFLGRPLPAGGRDAAVRVAAGLPPTGAPPRADRGGVVRLADATLLLVNLDGDGVARGPYPNRFVRDEGGVRLTWFPGPGHGHDSPLIVRLLDSAEPTLLFARLRRGKGGPGSPFVLLGRADAPRVEWGDRGGLFEWRLPDLGRAVGRGESVVDAILKAGRWDGGAVARLF